MKQCISVLGSTGSIGTQTLEVAKELNISVSALSAGSNIELVEKQVRTFKPKIVAVKEESLALKLKNNIQDTSTKVLCGIDGICEVATEKSCDMVFSAISGIAGLIPTAEAIKSQKNVALANKETLVTAGSLIKKYAHEKKVKIFPIDSEHSAIFQCLEAIRYKKDLRKIILTASGGPFFGKSYESLKNVSISQALNHPNWSMGKKITIDSATMMNKGLEVIEAAHLFDIDVEHIEVIVHPQSIVHSAIELADFSIIAQMAMPSMKIPIQYALTYPRHIASQVKPLELFKYKNLSFFKPDDNGIKALDICKKAFTEGTSKCIVLNGSNEKAVELFIGGKIKFTDIIKIVETCCENLNFDEVTDLNQIEKIDIESKKYAEKIACNL